MKRMIALFVSAVVLTACSSPTDVKPRPLDAKPQVAKAKQSLNAASGASTTSGRLVAN